MAWTGGIEIAGRLVGGGAPCFIIAEAGVNHNGDPGLARRLVDAAAEAGADAVKFQTFRADQVAALEAPQAEYQRQGAAAGESQQDMLRRLELSPEAHYRLQALCQARGLVFLSTPFDRASADLLEELGVPAFKVGSGEITNWPFLRHLALKGRPLILSTGMSYLDEVEAAVRVVREAGGEEVILLHCVSSYPADPAEANLRAMDALAAACQAPVGFSDHTPGIAVALAAAALGACVLEKHFTLDRNLPGPDHRASLEPEELWALVAGVRTVEGALGSGVKAPAPSEKDNRLLVRRSLVAARDLGPEETLEPGMLTALRPGGGISPAETAQVLGRRVKRALKAGQPISWGDLG